MVDCASRRNPSELLPKFKTYHSLAARPEEGGKLVHGLRISGSAAMSIAMAARGAVDMYAEIGVSQLTITHVA
jgi:myo-inositol-1(or 4)-monophosphatase